MQRSALILLTAILLTAIPLSAATYYVSPSGSGDTSGSDRDNCMTQAEAEDDDASPGDIFLYQPGTYAVINPDSIGTSEAWITYQADPGTCDGMDSGWWANTITKHTDSTHAVTTEIKMRSKGAGTPTPQYLVIDGFSVVCDDPLWMKGGAINFAPGSVRAVTVQNIMCWGVTPDDATYHFNTELTQHCISFMESVNGYYQDITIENIYGQLFAKGVYMAGQIIGNVEIKNVHLYDMCTTAVTQHANVQGTHADMVFDGLHIEKQSWKPSATPSYTDTIDTPGSPANLKFEYNGSVPSQTDYTSVTHSGSTAVRVTSDIEDLGGGDYRVTVNAAFPWDVSASDSFSFHDAMHASGVAIYEPIHLKNSIIHNFGNTGTVYTYGTTAEDICVENCLFYAPYNAVSFAVWMGNYAPGDGMIFRNNTVIGRRHVNYPGNARYKHGLAAKLQGKGGTDYSTWNVSNNIVVGRMYVTGGTIYGNHIWNNESNFINNDVNDCVVYCDDSSPSDPDIFTSTATTPYFVCGAGWDDMLISAGSANLNAGAKLVSGSPAVNAATEAYATSTDREGQARSDPDVGFDELDGGGGQTYYLLIRGGS